MKKSKRKIDKIILHCSATPAGRNVSVGEIRRWHKQRGWSDIGYHYVIDLDGNIDKGRDIDIVGAHTKGHNKHSIGICYVGGVDKDMNSQDTRTIAQMLALGELLAVLRDFYPEAEICGHNEFSSKDCPSFDVKVEYKYLMNL